MAWTRTTDADEAAAVFLPAWLSRMIGLRGRFGLLLGTGDVLRITSIAALYESSEGVLLADVLLDHAGVPDGVDQAWQTKHYLGAPVPGAVVATVNLEQVVLAVEFVVAEIAEAADPDAAIEGDEIDPANSPQQSPVGEEPALGVVADASRPRRAAVA